MVKIKILQTARPEIQPGEVVTTTEACADLLVRLGQAEIVKEEPKKAPAKKTTKKASK